jgi:Restriction endonuclease
MGLTASTEAEVQGARAAHRVDVLVSFDLLGLVITWIVECKLWRTTVSKEKVVALYQIAQDVGADRAFLFSENGFQPGAVAAARRTNISLTNLADLRDIARDDIAALRLRAVISHLIEVERSARSGFTDEEGALSRPAPESFDESIYLAGCCLFLERAAVRGLVGEFPVRVTSVDSSRTEEFANAHDLAAFLVGEVDEMRRRLAKRSAVDARLPADTVAFVDAVQSLLDASEDALVRLKPSDKLFEARRYDCLALMKAVGRGSENLRLRGDRSFQDALRAVMRHLIDTVYLDLTKPGVAEGHWRRLRGETERRLAKLRSLVPLSENNRGADSF